MVDVGHEREVEVVLVAEAGMARLVVGAHAEDDHVVYQFTMKCKTRAGKDYINDYLFLVKLKGGKLWRFQEYWDSKQAAELLFG